MTLTGGTVISALTYADDSALICKDAEEASKRVSAVRLGFRADGDKEVSQPKTEAMKIVRRMKARENSEEEYSEALDHDCEFCGRTLIQTLFFRLSQLKNASNQ